MRRFRDGNAFAAFLLQTAAQVPHAVHVGLEHAGELVEKDAKARLGHYQKGWAPLSEATQARRVKAGHTPDDPLLASGALRESIHHRVQGDTVEIGSSEKKALYQEVGTSKIPPRPFLGPALAENAKAAVDAAVAPLLHLLRGGPAS